MNYENLYAKILLKERLMFMPNKYTKKFKKRVTETILLKKNSTSIMAREFNVPLKTVEKWITAYNKDSHCFDEEDVNQKSLELNYKD